MCIIAAKPAGVAFPTKATLQTCFNNNPDGAGFMSPTADGSGVEIHKGYTSFSGFWKALKAARAATGDAAPYVLHFRISTQAGTRRDCTHPFPLSRNMDDLRELHTTAAVGMAHNGIISLTSHTRRGITHSDTMEFVTDYASLIIKSPADLQDPDRLTLLDRLAGSRLAFMDGAGNITRTGKGWQEQGGVWYSNNSYMDYWGKPPKSKGAGDTLTTPPPYSPYSWYEFEPSDCPAYDYNDDRYCSTCANKRACYDY